jgi:hypothetical protein
MLLAPETRTKAVTSVSALLQNAAAGDRMSRIVNASNGFKGVISTARDAGVGVGMFAFVGMAY